MIYAFDLINTVVDVSNAQDSDLESYGEQIKVAPWKPLILPTAWCSFPAFYEARGVLMRLRNQGHHVVTMSNAPLWLQVAWARSHNIRWDAMLPLEMIRRYKPDLCCYDLILQTMRCKPEEVLMVTANKNFGDIEAAKSLGMGAKLIHRDPGRGLNELL